MMVSIFLAAYLLQATYIDLFNDGHRLLDQGKPKEAETVLKESASLNPSHIPTLRDLADAYVRLKRFPEAIELYQKVLDINPKDINARGHLAELYSWTGDHDKAIVTYRDALELDPKNLGLKTGLAKVLRWSHRYDESERLYKDAIAQDPENYEALKGLAKVYSMTGDLTNAASTLDKAISLYPNDSELHKERGTVLGWQKDFKHAVAELNKSIELSPNYTDAYRTLGDVYLWMKSYRLAVDAYKKATYIEPANHENYLLLARIYKQTGDRTHAEEAVKAALRIDPSNAAATDMLREMRGSTDYQVLSRAGDIFEITAFVFVFVLLFFTYRSRRRMLQRRHRLYYYFINFVLPALVLVSFASFIGRSALAGWLDGDIIEDVTEGILFFALGTSLLALLWTEHRSREFSDMVILAVGAHPDDIELGCGGFIMKAKDSGAKVYGLTMTKGERGTAANGKREEELKKAASYMELDGCRVLDFPDTELSGFVNPMKDAMEERIKETKATVVLTHTAIDIHSDHQAVFEATKVAARNISIFCYEDVSTPREFVPNYFVDVAGYIDDKLRLISFHRTQNEKTYMDPEVIKGRAAHRGIQSGVQFAEAFRIYKLIK